MAVDLKKWRKALDWNDKDGIRKCITDGVDVTQSLDGAYGPVPPLSIVAGDGKHDLVAMLFAAGKDYFTSASAEAEKDMAFSLCKACDSANLKTVQFLVENGANVNFEFEPGNYHSTPLVDAIFCAEGKKGVEIVKFLLDNGADPIQTKSGKGILNSAAIGCGVKGVIAELVAKGADPNKAIGFPTLPLITAVDSEDKMIIKEFLEAGADPTLHCSDSGRNAIEFARDANNKKIVAMLEEYAGSSTNANSTKATSSKSKKLPTMNKLLQEIDEALENCGWAESFAEGATAKELKLLEESTQIKVNKEFKDFLTWHNGQNDYECLFADSFEGYYFLKADEMISEWNVWNELLEYGEFEDAEVSNDNEVKADWWNAKWMPIAGNGAGDFLCADFGPAKAGKKGQIIAMWHDDSRRELLFGSMREMLADLLGQLQE